MNVSIYLQSNYLSVMGLSIPGTYYLVDAPGLFYSPCFHHSFIMLFVFRLLVFFQENILFFTSKTVYTFSVVYQFTKYKKYEYDLFDV